MGIGHKLGSGLVPEHHLLITSRSPAPERFARPPGLSQTACRSYCPNTTDGSWPRMPLGMRASPAARSTHLIKPASVQRTDRSA
jgi:hypothetical protein